MTRHTFIVSNSDRFAARVFAALCIGITLLLVAAGCQNGGTLKVGGLREPTVDDELRQGDRLYAEQDENGARAVYERIVLKQPTHAGVNARLGRMAFQHGNYDEAVSRFREAMKAEPGNFHFALCLAQTLSRIATTAMDRPKAMEAAARAYRHAQSLDRTNFTATIQLAMCYREQGDFDKALETLREAARLYPNAAPIHVQLGEIYHSQNEFTKALEEYNLALKNDPKNLAAHNGCGVVNTALASKGGAKGSLARERAVAHFRRSLALNTNQPQIRGMLDQLEPYQWKAVTVAEEAPE
ncbi:MAG: tetratricopeptide repeat protein [Planctomycetes bacterium]|nr:tetratricopeptide repeat protein [Planctomycetota bacterium]